MFLEFVSQEELQFNHMVKVADSVYTMMCTVAASQPQTKCVYVDMLPCVWLAINALMVLNMSVMKTIIYFDNNVSVSTITRGIIVTNDQQIQLVTVDRDADSISNLNAYLFCNWSLTFYLVSVPESDTRRQRANKIASTKREQEQVWFKVL
jgi:hypothetical protein